MKRWILLVGLGILLWRSAPSNAADVGKLLPVELLYIYKEGEMVVIETDNDLSGKGRNLEKALSNLYASASGTVFLDTADTVLVTNQTEPLIIQMKSVLRPSCNICLLKGKTDLKKAAEYLRTHRTDRTVLDLRNGKKELPCLISKEGRLLLNEG